MKQLENVVLDYNVGVVNEKYNITDVTTLLLSDELIKIGSNSTNSLILLAYHYKDNVVTINTDLTGNFKYMMQVTGNNLLNATKHIVSK